LKNIFAIQDDITQKIVIEMAVKLAEGENERVMRHPTGNVEAWIHYRRAVAAFRKFTKASNLKSRELSEKAIELDSDYSVAYSLLSWTYAWLVRAGFSKSPAEDLNKAEELVEKAQELDPKNPDAQNQLGFIYMLRGDYDRAIEEGKKAVELAPNVSGTHAHLAASQIFSGQYQKAIAGLKQAMRLAPFYPWWYAHMLGEAYFCVGLYEEALSKFEEALKRAPDPNRLAWKAASYQALGRTDEARATIEEALTLKPTFSVEQWRKRYMLSYRDKAQVDRILAYVRQAGLPETPPLPLPDKPSIAVLPFVNMSGDPEQEYFSDGMTDDLITDLSKISGLFVIARNSTFTYKWKSVKIRQVAEDLGVRYVLEGSVRKVDNRVRINAQLIDATTGQHLWANRYDGTLGDVFELQDEINQKIVSALAVKLTVGEQEQAARKDTDNLLAYDSFLKGQEHYHRWTPEDFEKAASYLKKAIELDPSYGKAYAVLGSLYFYSIRNQWGLWGMEYEAWELAKKTMKSAMKNPTSLAHWLASQISLEYREHEKAIAEAERAIAIDPNEPDNHIQMARALIFIGRPKEAFDFVKRAMRLDPHYPAYYLFVFGLAHFAEGELEEAVSLFERTDSLNPEFRWHRAPLAAAYGHLGRIQEAKEALYKYRAGTASLGTVMFRWPFKDPRVVDRFVEGLRKAGIR
jgi:TolB-like protein/Flp pilus assembly protein TadD